MTTPRSKWSSSPRSITPTSGNTTRSQFHQEAMIRRTSRPRTRSSCQTQRPTSWASLYQRELSECSRPTMPTTLSSSLGKTPSATPQSTRTLPSQLATPSTSPPTNTRPTIEAIRRADTLLTWTSLSGTTRTSRQRSLSSSPTTMAATSPSLGVPPRTSPSKTLPAASSSSRKCSRPTKSTPSFGMKTTDLDWMTSHYIEIYLKICSLRVHPRSHVHPLFTPCSSHVRPMSKIVTGLNWYKL